MKKIALVVCAAVAMACGTARAGDMPAAKAPDNPGFEKMKSLAGTWTTEMDGKKMSNTYSVVSSGTCVMETITAPDGSTMITMYRASGPNIMLDHYCGLGNVPHMKGTMAADGTYTFAFTSGENMKPKDMHMHAMRMTIADADHMTQAWTLYADGKPQGEPHVMQLTRSAQ